MTEKLFAGRWMQARGALLRFWGRVTGDTLLRFLGEQDTLNGHLRRQMIRAGASRRSSLRLSHSR
jgi:uncharacterized protein YjbJ (UPF0337 family)